MQVTSDPCQKYLTTAPHTNLKDVYTQDQSNNNSFQDPFFLSSTLTTRFRIIEKIGSGSFGQIYKAFDNELSEEIALKIENHAASNSQTLVREAQILEEIGGVLGIPAVYIYAKEDTYSVLEMELLGPNLEKLLKRQNRQFSLKTVLMLAEQMLKRIEYVHSKGYLHRDIKPENFVIGNTSQDPKTLYLIDFGLSKMYKEGTTGKHISYKENKGLVGTARYASITTHLGIEQSRRDDLESIGYLMIYFLKGSLPWQNIKSQSKTEKYKLIAESKMATIVEILCRGEPREFLYYFNHVKNLTFTDTPDYKYLRGLFRKLMTDNNWSYDYEYDWCMSDQRKSSENPKGSEKQQQKKIIATLGTERKLESGDGSKNKYAENNLKSQKPRLKLNSSPSKVFRKHLNSTSKAEDSVILNSGNQESKGCDSVFKSQSANKNYISSQPNNQNAKKSSQQYSSPMRPSNSSTGSNKAVLRHSWVPPLSSFHPKPQDDAKILSKVALTLFSRAKTNTKAKPNLHLDANLIHQDGGTLTSPVCNSSRGGMMMPDRPTFSICHIADVQDDDTDNLREENKGIVSNPVDRRRMSVKKDIRQSRVKKQEEYNFAEEEIHEKDKHEALMLSQKEIPVRRLEELKSLTKLKETHDYNDINGKYTLSTARSLRECRDPIFFSNTDTNTCSKMNRVSLVGDV